MAVAWRTIKQDVNGAKSYYIHMIANYHDKNTQAF